MIDKLNFKVNQFRYLPKRTCEVRVIVQSLCRERCQTARRVEMYVQLGLCMSIDGSVDRVRPFGLDPPRTIVDFGTSFFAPSVLEPSSC